MKYQNLWFFLTPLVFLLGFLCGSYWQAHLFRTAVPETRSSTPPPPVVTAAPPTATTEEEKLAQALEDPDFKRVHDFLVREKPMQMDLDPPKKEENTVPFSERKPFQFDVSE